METGKPAGWYCHPSSCGTSIHISTHNSDEVGSRYTPSLGLLTRGYEIIVCFIRMVLSLLDADQNPLVILSNHGNVPKSATR